MEELSILITIFVSVGIIVFFISTLIKKQYYHRKKNTKKDTKMKKMKNLFITS